jgi:hypothetical protein
MLSVHDDDIGLMALVALDASALGVALRRLVPLDMRVVTLRGALARNLAERMAMRMHLRARRLVLQNLVNAAVRDLMLAVVMMRMGHYFFTFP